MGQARGCLPRHLSQCPLIPGVGDAGECLAKKSYFEVEVASGRVVLFERQGDGMTSALVEALSRYGLALHPKVSSWCG